MDDTSKANRPLSLDAIDDDQARRTLRLHIEEAAWWLNAGLNGDVPLGRAVMEADVTFAQAVGMMRDHPFGWLAAVAAPGACGQRRPA